MKDQKYRSLKAIMGAFETFNPNTKQRMTHREEDDDDADADDADDAECQWQRIRKMYKWNDVRANVLALALIRPDLEIFTHEYNIAVARLWMNPSA